MQIPPAAAPPTLSYTLTLPVGQPDEDGYLFDPVEWVLKKLLRQTQAHPQDQNAFQARDKLIQAIIGNLARKKGIPASVLPPNLVKVSFDASNSAFQIKDIQITLKGDTPEPKGSLAHEFSHFDQALQRTILAHANFPAFIRGIAWDVSQSLGKPKILIQNTTDGPISRDGPREHGYYPGVPKGLQGKFQQIFQDLFLTFAVAPITGQKPPDSRELEQAVQKRIAAMPLDAAQSRAWNKLGGASQIAAELRLHLNHVFHLAYAETFPPSKMTPELTAYVDQQARQLCQKRWNRLVGAIPLALSEKPVSARGLSPETLQEIRRLWENRPDKTTEAEGRPLDFSRQLSCQGAAFIVALEGNVLAESHLYRHYTEGMQQSLDGMYEKQTNQPLDYQVSREETRANRFECATRFNSLLALSGKMQSEKGLVSRAAAYKAYQDHLGYSEMTALLKTGLLTENANERLGRALNSTAAPDSKPVQDTVKGLLKYLTVSLTWHLELVENMIDRGLVHRKDFTPSVQSILRRRQVCRILALPLKGGYWLLRKAARGINNWFGITPPEKA